MLENVVDPSCNRCDWTRVCASAMNDFTFDSILLVSNPEGSPSCRLQLRPRRVLVWDDVVLGILKGDIVEASVYLLPWGCLVYSPTCSK